MMSVRIGGVWVPATRRARIGGEWVPSGSAFLGWTTTLDSLQAIGVPSGVVAGDLEVSVGARFTGVNSAINVATGTRLAFEGATQNRWAIAMKPYVVADGPLIFTMGAATYLTIIQSFWFRNASTVVNAAGQRIDSALIGSLAAISGVDPAAMFVTGVQYSATVYNNGPVTSNAGELELVDSTLNSTPSRLSYKTPGVVSSLMARDYTTTVNKIGSCYVFGVR